MNPLRVLHVVTYMGRGGLETMIMNYYRHIDRTKVQFDFLVHREFEADYDNEILKLGGRIYHVPPLNPFSPIYFRALNSFFSRHHYEIVHSHLDCMSAYPLKIAKRYGVKTRIAHAHNKNQDHNFKYLIKMYSKHLIPRYATDLFACSAEAGKWMFSGHKFKILRNAIDTKKYLYNPQKEKKMKESLHIQNKFVIGHVGRFDPQKNHGFLIDIFHCVEKIEKSSVLLLVGTGCGKSEIEDKVKKLGLKDKVFFLGSRSDVPEILQAVDVFVFPSLYEGLSVATVEAQAAGIPCILSDQIPHECKFVENVEFLSLNLSFQGWADHILKYLGRTKKNELNAICKAGYDIKDNAKQLQKFYLSRG